MTHVASTDAPPLDRRIDPLTGITTYIVGSRQNRPNLPVAGCPFCIGGLEAPEPYELKAFPNRWPALGRGRAEVVLYSPIHDASLSTLGHPAVRKVIDLWAERTSALNAEPGVGYTLVFENRGTEIGATIPHPHGQIYAFDHVPELVGHQLRDGRLDRPDDTTDPASRTVASVGDWTAWVPFASPFPYAIRIASGSHVADLASLDGERRDHLATLLIDVLSRLDRLFDAPTPYMMWIHQRPADAAAWPDAEMHIEIVTPWRAAHVARYIAAGEVASGEYFNTVVPEQAAATLRTV